MSDLLHTIENTLKQHFPEGHIKLLADDLDGLHLTVSVTASQFKGLTLIEQHRLVQNAMKEFFQNGSVHAIKIRTMIKT